MIPKPTYANVIDTKWILENKIDDKGCVRKKARLFAQGYYKIKGVDFGKMFTLMAWLETILLLLDLACIHKFKLYQMDVKSTFLNGYLNEEVYIAQPKGFMDPTHPGYVYKLHKALYGLK